MPMAEVTGSLTLLLLHAHKSWPWPYRKTSNTSLTKGSVMASKCTEERGR